MNDKILNKLQMNSDIILQGLEQGVREDGRALLEMR